MKLNLTNTNFGLKVDHARIHAGNVKMSRMVSVLIAESSLGFLLELNSNRTFLD